MRCWSSHSETGGWTFFRAESAVYSGWSVFLQNHSDSIEGLNETLTYKTIEGSGVSPDGPVTPHQMNFVNQILIAVFVAISLGDCATPFRAPPDVAHITFERKDSPVVIVEKIWLERTQGRLFLKGYVVGRPSVTDTTQTHLDVTLYDESNRVLRTSVADFFPRQIPGLRPPQIPSRRIRQSYSHYSIVLDPLPPGTVRIEVRAYEGLHSAAGSPASK